MWKGTDEEGEWYLLRANKGHVTPEGQAAPSETQREFLLCKEIKRDRTKKHLKLFFCWQTYWIHLWDRWEHSQNIFFLSEALLLWQQDSLGGWLMLGWGRTFENVASWWNSAWTSPLCCSDPELHRESTAFGMGFDYWTGGWLSTQVTAVLRGLWHLP